MIDRTLKTLRAIARKRRSSKKNAKLGRLCVDRAPFDRELLAESRLYVRSRELFLATGGKFISEVVSPERHLTGDFILTPKVLYGPTDNEWLWLVNARDPKAAFAQVKPFSVVLFHEQNHRILASKFGPDKNASTAELSRYLNWEESAVILLDRCLGDEMSDELEEFFYQVGVGYGSPHQKTPRSLKKKKLRNYLRAYFLTTYCYLEGIRPEFIPPLIAKHLPDLDPKQRQYAVSSSIRLEKGFAYSTNPLWKSRYAKVRLKNSRLRKGVRRVKIPAVLTDLEPFFSPLDEIFDLYGLG